jgi:hypothetical protein
LSKWAQQSKYAAKLYDAGILSIYNLQLIFLQLSFILEYEFRRLQSPKRKGGKSLSRAFQPDNTNQTMKWMVLVDGSEHSAHAFEKG